MASGIDPTKPVAGNASTSNVRANFSAAETEINELQRATEDAVTAGGTVNALTANFTTDVVLAEGVTIVVKAIGANTGTTTIDVDSTGAKSIVNPNGNAIGAGGEIVNNKHHLVLRFDAANTVWVLMNSDIANDSFALQGGSSAFHLDRTNHTGAQAQSTVTDLTSDLALKAPLVSPAFTGTPNAPTQSVGDNSIRLATTEYVQQEFDGTQQSKATNGFQKLPGGLILQWGKTTSISSGTTVSLNTTFPTAPLNVTLTPEDASNFPSFGAANLTTSNFVINHGGGNSTETFFWQAIGH